MKDIKGKFMIAFDTVCDGWQCTNDHEGNPNPEFFDSEEEAFRELFSDAISGLEGTDDDFFEENDLDKDKVIAEMKALLKEGSFEKMSKYLDDNPTCNYYEDFVIPAEEFVLGRKAIFTGKGIVIEGTKLEDL